MKRGTVVIGILALAASVMMAAQGGSVRVTTARANIRAEASETSAVLLQVVQGTLLDLIAVEGDWFHVRVPVSGVRVEAYISKKVSKLEAPAPGTPAPAKPAPFPKPAPESRDGMSVAMTVGAATGNTTGWLVPNSARVIEIGDKVDSISKIAPTMPAGDAPPAGASGSTQVTFVWVADGAAATRVVTDARPGFIVQFKEVPGMSPDDLAPALVRLSAAASGVRVIAAVRGRADQSSRTDADWDVMKDLKQDLVRSEIQLAERGVVRITPTADLPAGQYAIVLRPATRKKLSGAGVLRTTGEARVFTVVWDFMVNR